MTTAYLNGKYKKLHCQRGTARRALINCCTTVRKNAFEKTCNRWM